MSLRILPGGCDAFGDLSCDSSGFGAFEKRYEFRKVGQCVMTATLQRRDIPRCSGCDTEVGDNFQLLAVFEQSGRNPASFFQLEIDS